MQQQEVTARRGKTGRAGIHDPAVVPIEPAFQRDADELKVPRRGRTSPWRTQLEMLVDMVHRGEVEAHKFVVIGEFKSKQGAQHRAVRLPEVEPELADGWVFDYRWEYLGERSRLWARVTTVQQAAEAARVEQPTGGDA